MIWAWWSSQSNSAAVSVWSIVNAVDYYEYFKLLNVAMLISFRYDIKEQIGLFTSEG